MIKLVVTLKTRIKEISNDFSIQLQKIFFNSPKNKEMFYSRGLYISNSLSQNEPS
jgi:hypothetical protein